METLSNYIVEKLSFGSLFGNKNRPKNIKELRKLIVEQLKEQGPDADLNFIDTSKITDMSWLFSDLKIRNIKIDKWDTSNVTKMVSMFEDCEDFNADLSAWDVSKVENMTNMFSNCHKFNSDLSKWDVSNVTSIIEMFFFLSRI